MEICTARVLISVVGVFLVFVTERFTISYFENYDEGIELDEQNGNLKWQSSTELEMIQLKEYDTFID